MSFVPSPISLHLVTLDPFWMLMRMQVMVRGVLFVPFKKTRLVECTDCHLQN